MSLFEELIEDKGENKKIIKTFKPKDELSLDIFEKTKDGYIMREEIRKKLMEITNDFIETFDVDFFIHDVVLTGSLANFNWSEYSDVDLHIIIDMDELGSSSDNKSFLRKIFKEFFDSKKSIWNNKRDIFIKNFEVEVYVEDVNEKHISSGVYSILNNNWVVEPKKDTPNIDDRKIIEKAEYFEKTIDKIKENKSKSKSIELVNDFFERLKKFRQCGLEKGGEYSYENLTFKLLRRNGSLEELVNVKNKSINKSLSLKESPDLVQSNRGNARWDDKDAIPFGLYNDRGVVGFNGNLSSNEEINGLFDEVMYHGQIPYFYEELHDIGIIKQEIDFRKNKSTVGYWRTMFEYPGRLWFNKKIISFWTFPETDEELISLLNKVNDEIELIYGVSLNFKDYEIEIKVAYTDEGEIYELIPLSKYIGGYVDTSKKDMEIPHLMKPEDKLKSQQMRDVLDKNIERTSKIEKDWDSMAKRNFILKKNIAENN